MNIFNKQMLSAEIPLQRVSVTCDLHRGACPGLDTVHYRLGGDEARHLAIELHEGLTQGIGYVGRIYFVACGTLYTLQYP
jgi:hypothetical protein